MELPRWNTVEGVYTYFMGLLVLLAILLAVYVVGVYVGVFPPPESFVETESPALLAPPVI